MKACFLFFLVLTVIPGLAQEQSEFAKYKQAVIHANDLAGRIHFAADAINYVSAISFLFPRELDPAWANAGIRSQLASAEYESASNVAKLIPEQRLADVWNQYVCEIGAPNGAIVTPAEIHNIRDLNLTGAQSTWTADRATRWTLPNMYATGSDGRVAAGCRAVEALRVIYDLNSFFPLISARERISKGIVPSEEARKPKSDGTGRIVIHGGPVNPMDSARQGYIRKHGWQAYDQLLTRLFNELFPNS
jgi:hypothetical protein